MALEELRHRQSFDLDFHTRRALVDVRPILAEIERAFPGRFETVAAPDEFGSGFKGILTVAKDQKVTIEVLANYQDVPQSELTSSQTEPKMRRLTRQRFLADKIQCVAERSEARDLVDITALLRRFPELTSRAKELLSEQDAVIVSEKLLAWTDTGIRSDLASYPDVDPTDAQEARDLLLSWLKPEKREGEA